MGIWDHNAKAVTACLQGSCQLHGSFSSRPKRELEGVCGLQSSPAHSQHCSWNFIYLRQVDRQGDQSLHFALVKYTYQMRQIFVSEIPIPYCGTPVSCLNFISQLKKQKAQYVAYDRMWKQGRTLINFYSASQIPPLLCICYPEALGPPALSKQMNKTSKNFPHLDSFGLNLQSPGLLQVRG